MKKTILLASAAMIGAGVLAAHVNAQGFPQTVEIAKVDVQRVAAGYRASKVIGSSVLNDANETIGKIDDLLVTRDGKEMLWGRRRGCGTFGAFRANRRGAPCRSRMTPTNPLSLLSRITR